MRHTLLATALSLALVPALGAQKKGESKTGQASEKESEWESVRRVKGMESKMLSAWMMASVTEKEFQKGMETGTAILKQSEMGWELELEHRRRDTCSTFRPSLSVRAD